MTTRRKLFWISLLYFAEGLPAADAADEAGYQVYHVPDPDTGDADPAAPAEPPPPPPSPPAAVVAESLPAARGNGLLVAAAVIALIALILTVVL